YQRDRYNRPVAFGHRVNGPWKTISSQEWLDDVNTVARAFVNYGIKKGDKIAIVSGNRIEWQVLDQAILKAGAISVPVYPTISIDDYKYIFNHSEIRLCFTSDKGLYNKILKVKDDTPALEGVFTFDEGEGMPSWKEFVEKYNDVTLQEKLEEVASTVEEDDVATLIYTSGTTGTPKGVQLTHRNILTNAIVAMPLVAEVEEKVALSFLPLCHVFQHTVDVAYQLLGCSIYYAKSTETIATDAQTVHPVVMMVVPRVIERIYAKVIAKGQALKGIKKAIFFWAVSVGRKYKPYSKNVFYNAQLWVARKLVFNKWREALGGDLNLIISGSSALDPRLSRLFCATGMMLNEGYGLTESSPIISTNIYKDKGLKIGSIGRPLPCNEVKIAEDGEILVKGPCVMKGYYKDPERTAEAIDSDGYLHTGDVGYLKGGFLYITDRKKEMFKTSGGKYITPQPMEIRLCRSKYIEQAMVIGDSRQHPGVIIEPDMAELKAWCQAEGIDTSDLKAMVAHEKVQKLYRGEVNEVNKKLSSWEKMKRFHVVTDTWTVDNKLITPTLKLKRKNLMELYASEIAEMYKDEEKNNL
ncbi:MAG: long-chain fatty acid--CoA ligase, partial [Flavobacteriales bacterium]|nr:long-chain fatty acid--CoA ligase [Flavobacteriales bacterium]